MTKTAVDIDALMKELGEVLAEAKDELIAFSSPEEGFFMAIELMNAVMTQLAIRYDGTEPVASRVLRNLAEMNNTMIIQRQRATIDMLAKLRRERLEGELTQRLEDLESREDVDLGPVKKRVAAIVAQMTAHHGLDIIELGVKANLV